MDRSYLLDLHGQPADLSSCLSGSPSQATLVRCVTRQHVHWTVTSQPADRYWAFQWIEFGVYLLAAGGLAAIAIWRIPQITARPATARAGPPT